MHKIDKFISKLDAGRREKVLAILSKIHSGNLENLNLKKLKGFGFVYRVRVGKCRIIFEIANDITNILYVDFKDDNTYRL